ncbi:STAS domain-containing protein [Amycolatopsis sp. NPDC051128]|uniref:STAS domain-containing protein n=1 Tax=Amycolatopsis sp. NPDC051128 TaxID=3155412 RepID=UPI003423B3B0
MLVVEARGERGLTAVLRGPTVLEAAICELPAPHLLVVDLTMLTYLSARGTQALLQAVKRCRHRGIAACLIARPGGVVDRVVWSTGLAEVVPVFPNRLTAIAASQPTEVRWLPN